MSLLHLDHFLIQTTDMDATRDWWVDILGLRVGPSPDFRFPVCWLYIGDTDVVHLTTGGGDVSDNRKAYLGQQSTATEGSGVVDHIAFRASGLQDVMARLKSHGVEFTKRMVSDQGQFQLFLLDPNGVKIELTFSNEEAADIAPELIASAMDG